MEYFFRKELITLDMDPNTGFWVLVLIALLFTSFGSVFFLVYWAAAVVPLLFAYTATVFLYSLELAVRRIAEYPKGPILAITAGCGDVAAALKFFG